MNPNAGTYRPNEPGARTLRESVEMTIDGKPVSAIVDGEGGYSVFVGTSVVAYGQLNGTEGDLMSYFAAEALNAVASYAPAEELTETVQQVRAEGVAKMAYADTVEAMPPVVKRGRAVPLTDPTHPVQRAGYLRRDAATLVVWTNEDEQGYQRYVSDGIGDTDGYYAPLDRPSWKFFETS